MGFFDTLLGKGASETSRAAAQDQYNKQVAAGSQSADAFRNLATSFDPYRQGGTAAQNRVYDLLGLNGAPAQSNAYSTFRSDPGYQFALEQGIGAIDKSAAARGNLNSGATLKALQQYGQGMADQSYGNYLARLMALGQQGLGATQSAVGTQAQGLQNQFGANYGSAGTIGQGMVAGANAEAGALGNLLGVAGYLGGAALGGPLGGSLGNLMGGSRTSSYAQPTSFMQGGQQWPMYR